MAIEEMREVQTPLDGDTGDDTSTTDTGNGGGDEGNEGHPDFNEQAAAPARTARQPSKGPDGRFNGKPPRADRRNDYRERQQLTEKVTGLEAQLRQRDAKYQRDIDDIRRMAEQARQPAPAAPAAGSSPIEQKLSTLKQAIASEVAAARAHDHSKGPYDLSRYEKLKEDYEDARLEARLPQILKQRGIDLDRRPDPNQRPLTQRDVAQTAEDAHRRATMHAEAPWLTQSNHPDYQARMKAFTGTIEYLENVEGRPRGVNTDREAAAIVERKFRIQSQRGPARAPRPPLTDFNRGLGGEDDGPATLEVPTSQLEGVDPAIVRRVAARMGGRR